MSDVKLLVGILEKIANICKDNMLECKKEVNFDNKYLSYGEAVGLTSRKYLSEEIFTVIKKGLNDS